MTLLRNFILMLLAAALLSACGSAYEKPFEEKYLTKVLEKIDKDKDLRKDHKLFLKEQLAFIVKRETFAKTANRSAKDSMPTYKVAIDKLLLDYDRRYSAWERQQKFNKMIDEMVSEVSVEASLIDHNHAMIQLSFGVQNPYGRKLLSMAYTMRYKNRDGELLLRQNKVLNQAECPSLNEKVMVQFEETFSDFTKYAWDNVPRVKNRDILSPGFTVEITELKFEDGLNVKKDTSAWPYPL